MAGVILGEGAPTRTLFLPPGVKPKFTCLVCGAKFFEWQSERYQRHVGGCANYHEEELRELSDRTQHPALHDPRYEGSDVEFSQWVRTNRALIKERRKKM